MPATGCERSRYALRTMRGARRTRALLLAASIVATSALRVARPPPMALQRTMRSRPRSSRRRRRCSRPARSRRRARSSPRASGSIPQAARCSTSRCVTSERARPRPPGRSSAMHASSRSATGATIASTLADEHMAALEPKLSKLVVSVAPTADVPDVEVRDGRARRSARRVGHGDARRSRRARDRSGGPGKKRWRTRVTVLPDADLKTVVVPDSEDDLAAPGRRRRPSPPTPVGIERPPPPPRTITPPRSSWGAWARLTRHGSYFGLHAIGKHQDSRDACTTNPCSQTSSHLSDSAKTFADISTVTFAVGVAGLGVGASCGSSRATRAPLATPATAYHALGPHRPRVRTGSRHARFDRALLEALALGNGTVVKRPRQPTRTFSAAQLVGAGSASVNAPRSVNARGLRPQRWNPTGAALARTCAHGGDA